MAEKKTLTLMSSDGDEFQVDESAALLSQTIKHMIEDECANTTIPLPNVTSKTLSKVIEYCNKHASSTEDTSDELLKAFDKEFMDIGQDVLYDLIMASNYLDIKMLLDLACQKAADMIKGKKPEEIRTTFNIKNDFTPEEEEEIRKENAWAFE